MHHALFRGAALAAVLLSPAAFGQQRTDPDPIPGERLPAAAVSAVVVETMGAVIERERTADHSGEVHGEWRGQDGRWFVPPMTARAPSRSGVRALVNEWGDPRMGIGFGRAVDVTSLWLAGHGVAPARAVVVVGYRGGAEVARTDPIALVDGLDAGGGRAWTDGMADVDRIELVAEPSLGSMGFFALDDLAYRDGDGPETVLDFEDLALRAVVSGTGYRGLDWEHGTGLRDAARDHGGIVHAPKAPADQSPDGGAAVEDPAAAAAMAGTAPSLIADFIGPQRGDPGGSWIPPDTCGAAGPDHFVSIINANLSVWRKADGARLSNVGLNTFFGQTVGDPRAAWDPHGKQFVILATDFSRSRTIYVAVTRTGDPTGAWVKFSFRTDQGSDAGLWPDYPTLGVDARGIYTSAYMVGSSARMTIWAMPTAPLYAATPAAPPVTAFRSLPYEGANQPCVTYGDPGVEYVVSRASSTTLRLRRVVWNAGTPSLLQHGFVSVPSHGSPPNAPALGSSTNVSTIDWRLINAVYRNGSVWTVQGVNSGGRAAVRWYELPTSGSTPVQIGTIGDPVWHYYYGSIAVDARGDVALGFSGSHAGSWINAFVTGRLAGDPAGETAPPIQFKAGEGAYTRVDGAGRNRWGDYSLTTVDPLDDLGFWTIQEYPTAGNQWGTWIARVGYETIPYGAGHAGTLGVPGLGATTRPVLGQTMTLAIGNSTGAGGTSAALAVGDTAIAQPLLGGTLLVQPIVVVSLTLPAGTTSYPVAMPNDPTLPGNSLFAQVHELDAGAAGGVSMSRGLEIRAVTR